MDKILNAIKDFWGNYMLVSAIISWFLAQVIKIFTNLFVKKKFDIKMMFSNGGMPSSHSATVLALSTSAAISCGFASPAFAISGILSVIVMNDAFGVRWQAGQQAQIINKMIGILFSNTDQVDVKLKEIIGHTPFQVFMGALLGIVVSVAYAFILKGFGVSVFAPVWL
ncbi:MAG: divergent PAP2 family protein [Clostridia bacterium]|nr:divergent PAP2 family protein [Clostridia bacterium]